jgi:hypothetical protein
MTWLAEQSGTTELSAWMVDVSFHSGYTGHMALPNRTDQARLAHVIIYMDEATTYSGAEHIVTDPLGLLAGDRLDGDTFPRPWA